MSQSEAEEDTPAGDESVDLQNGAKAGTSKTPEVVENGKTRAARKKAVEAEKNAPKKKAPRKKAPAKKAPAKEAPEMTDLDSSEEEGSTVNATPRQDGRGQRRVEILPDPVRTPLKEVEAIFAKMSKFDGNFAKWSYYKDTVNETVIHNTAIGDRMKRATIAGSLSETLQKKWELIQKTNTCAEAWTEFSRDFDDPKLLQMHLTKMISKMPYVKDEFDERNLTSLLEQVNDFSQAVDGLNAEDNPLVLSFNVLILSHLWPLKHMELLKKCNSLKEILKEIRELQHKASLFNSHQKIMKSKGESSRSCRQVIIAESDEEENDPPRKRSRMNVVKSSRPRICRLCNETGHYAEACEKELTNDQKRKIVLTKGLCFRCLMANHKTDDCYRKVLCHICKKDSHVTAIHGILFVSKKSNWIQDTKKEPVNSQTSSRSANFSRSFSSSEFHFKAIINGKPARVLMDTGADMSLISAAFILPGKKKRVKAFSVYGFVPGNIAIIVEFKAQFELTYKDAVGGRQSITLETHISKDIPVDEFIVGRDLLYRFLVGDSLTLRTILGNYSFKPRKSTTVAMKSFSLADEQPFLVDESAVKIEAYKLPSGRYGAKFPWFSSKRPEDNFPKAWNYLMKQKDILIRKNIEAIYESTLLEYVKTDQAEEVFDADGFFLPHHAVLRPEAVSTSIRIVFNASYGGAQSLNETLWKGGSEGLDVVRHLLQARLKKQYATIDLKKAFLQIEIAPEDRKYIKFLWYKGSSPRYFQLKVVPFGVKASPAILIKVISMICSEMSNDAKAMFEEASYMDDLLVGHEDKIILLKAIKEGKELFKKAGFDMHKVLSNVPEVRDLFQSDRTEGSLLGVHWNTISDVLSFKEFSLMKIETRRQLLSFIGKMFDPLGYLEPIKLKFRLLYSLTLDQDWDAPLEPAIALQTKNLMVDFKKVKDICVPRHIPLDNRLIGFSDACKTSYGYVFYLGQQMIFGKSKVLSAKHAVGAELQALYEMTLAMQRIVETLAFTGELILLSDSKSNLDRLNLAPNDSTPAVGRRTLAIQQVASKLNISFHHIPGKKNPADLFSRGCTVEKYPWEEIVALRIPELDEIVQKPLPVRSICIIQRPKHENEIASWANRKMGGYVIRRMINQLKLWMEKSLNRSRYLTVQESQIVLCQGQEETVPECCFKDERGLWRFNTRDLQLKPLWIPKDSNLAIELLEQAHVRSKHHGINISLSFVDPNHQIVGATRSMRKIIANCWHCKRLRAPLVQQPEGPMAEWQKKFFKPFECVSMDMFGPYGSIRGKKMYGLLVICRVTKAVKLQLLQDMSSKALKEALMKVWWAVGFPSVVWSDNGTNFVGLKNFIMKECLKGKIPQIQWFMSTPYAPWMNGVAERTIRTVKETLNLLPLKWASWREAEFSLSECEHIVNQRPVFVMDSVPVTAFEAHLGRKSFPSTDVTAEASMESVRKMQSAHFETTAMLFKQQYLKKIQLKKCAVETSLKIGEFVLVSGEGHVKRREWPIFKIIEVAPGKDGVTRNVHLEDMNGKRIWRHANLLVSLSCREGVAIG